MKIRFKTLGPFELKRHGNRLEPGMLQSLWSADPLSTDKVFRYAIGVYVIAVKQGRKLLPLYVGKSSRGFASRLNNHSIFSAIPEEYDGEGLFLFLLARVTPEKEKYLRAKRTDKDVARKSKRLRSIDELEFALIGTCMSLNPRLLNKQDKTFLDGLRVPGYINDPHEDLNQSATALRNMLT